MARSSITSAATDLNSDSGSILFSLVQGEQLELPVILNFIAIATSDYSYEAVLIEADNTVEDNTIPTAAKTGGVTNTLTVRVPTYRWAWVANTNYSRDNVVNYNGKFYKLDLFTKTSNVTPDLDPDWEEHLPNTIYIQFPSNLSLTYTTQPSVADPVYGYFELSVTEPTGGAFRRTWKPVRGLISFNYSPTQLVV